MSADRQAGWRLLKEQSGRIDESWRFRRKHSPERAASSARMLPGCPCIFSVIVAFPDTEKLNREKSHETGWLQHGQHCTQKSCNPHSACCYFIGNRWASSSRECRIKKGLGEIMYPGRTLPNACVNHPWHFPLPNKEYVSVCYACGIYGL